MELWSEWFGTGMSEAESMSFCATVSLYTMGRGD
jgi:hypothetical protein